MSQVNHGVALARLRNDRTPPPNSGRLQISPQREMRKPLVAFLGFARAPRAVTAERCSRRAGCVAVVGVEGEDGVAGWTSQGGAGPQFVHPVDPCARSSPCGSRRLGRSFSSGRVAQGVGAAGGRHALNAAGFVYCGGQPLALGGAFGRR